MAEAKTPSLATGYVAWLESLLGVSPDHEPYPGFPSHAWARVWANALNFLDRHGVEAAASVMALARKRCSPRLSGLGY
jgi:hypothetical protein